MCKRSRGETSAVPGGEMSGRWCQCQVGQCWWKASDEVQIRRVASNALDGILRFGDAKGTRAMGQCTRSARATDGSKWKNLLMKESGWRSGWHRLSWLMIGDGWWRGDRQLFLRRRRDKIKNGQKQKRQQRTYLLVPWRANWPWSLIMADMVAKIASAEMVDHQSWLVVGRFVAVPKDRRKGKRRQTSTKTYLSLPVCWHTPKANWPWWCRWCRW